MQILNQIHFNQATKIEKNITQCEQTTKKSKNHHLGAILKQRYYRLNRHRLQEKNKIQHFCSPYQKKAYLCPPN